MHRQPESFAAIERGVALRQAIAKRALSMRAALAVVQNVSIAAATAVKTCMIFIRIFPARPRLVCVHRPADIKPWTAFKKKRRP